MLNFRVYLAKKNLQNANFGKRSGRKNSTTTTIFVTQTCFFSSQSWTLLFKEKSIAPEKMMLVEFPRLGDD